MKRRDLLLGCAVGCVGFTLHAQQHIFVSPAGQGANCSEREPCSLVTAQQKARAHAGAGDVIVSLATGVYRLRQPLVFTPQDSGREGHPVRWVGDLQGTELEGSIRIRGWHRVEGKAHLWAASLPPDAMSQQLFVNGVRAVPARRAGCASPKQCSYTPQGLAGAAAALKGVQHPEEVVAVFGVRWRDFHCRVASVRGEDLVMAEPCWHNTVVDSVKNGWSNASPKGKPFKGVDWFENAYEFLGEPGQFYIDQRRRLVFYTPRANESMSTADVELPTVEHLVVVAGTPRSRVHDLSLEHLVLRYADWLYNRDDGYVPLQAGYLVTGQRNDLPHNGEGMLRIPAAVEVYGGLRVQFRGDTFRNLGAAGIALVGGTSNSSVEQSRFEDLSGGAVFVGDTVAHPATREERSSDNVIRRNVVTHIAVEYRDNVGIMAGFNDGLWIDHNTLSEMPYTGISAGWGWDYEGEEDVQRDVHIRANRISRFMLTLHDGGAIYTQAQSSDSDVTGNYISYRGSDNGNGIYLDERSRKYEVCGNVVWDRPAKMQEGQWISAWASWSGDLDIHDNWSNDPHTKLHQPGPTKKFYDNHLALTELPAMARQVIDASGADGHSDPQLPCNRK